MLKTAVALITPERVIAQEKNPNPWKRIGLAETSDLGKLKDERGKYVNAFHPDKVHGDDAKVKLYSRAFVLYSEAYDAVTTNKGRDYWLRKYRSFGENHNTSQNMGQNGAEWNGFASNVRGTTRQSINAMEAALLVETMMLYIRAANTDPAVFSLAESFFLPLWRRARPEVRAVCTGALEVTAAISNCLLNGLVSQNLEHWINANKVWSTLGRSKSAMITAGESALLFIFDVARDPYATTMALQSLQLLQGFEHDICRLEPVKISAQGYLKHLVTKGYSTYKFSDDAITLVKKLIPLCGLAGSFQGIIEEQIALSLTKDRSVQGAVWLMSLGGILGIDWSFYKESSIIREAVSKYRPPIVFLSRNSRASYRALRKFFPD